VARVAEAQASLAALSELGPGPEPAWAGADTCRQCGGHFRRAPRDLSLVCAGCGLVEAGDPTLPDDEPPQPSRDPARVRIVGAGSAPLQPDLHRSGQGPSAEAQQRQIFEEYQAYMQMFVEAGGRSFRLDALRRAAGYYNVVQRQCVKRSQNKKSIMAACLWLACRDVGIAPAKPDVAVMMQLQNRGIARGTNFLRSLVADGKMDIDVDADPCRPEVVSLFAHLGLEAPAFAPLREATHELVQVALERHVGTSSVLRSKVAGAAFEVLRRCRDRQLLPRPPDQAKFCQGWIRKNTLDRFQRELWAHHSIFAPTYRRAGLDDAPPPA
jgi:transcription initiation factor TFIIIB Brf1 subunit/transcription initiation factor TFIIB